LDFHDTSLGLKVYKVQSKPYIIYNPTVIFRVPGPVTRIDSFMRKIGGRGGMSLTTGFDVIFDVPDDVKEYYKDGDDDLVHMLCDEAQLPNVQTATGQMSGRYLGEQAVQYPHSRMFTDVGLGFLCDAELIPLKFFNNWYQYMFMEDYIVTSPYYWTHRTSQPESKNRTNRLKYQNQYAGTIKIMKTETGRGTSNGRAPITYLLENAYPYAIDAVPLSYGTSQITRVNVNFHYSRHTIIYGDNYRTSTAAHVQQRIANPVQTDNDEETATEFFDRTGRLPPG
jgi:hypothetical protein